MSYSEKLKDPRWQKKRLEILQRDEFTCQLCGDKETTLHVHHIKYKGYTDPWNYDNEILTTLCKHCHSFQESVGPVSLKKVVKKFLPEVEMVQIYGIDENNILHFVAIDQTNDHLHWQINFLESSFKKVVQFFNDNIQPNGIKIH